MYLSYLKRLNPQNYLYNIVHMVKHQPADNPSKSTHTTKIVCPNDGSTNIHWNIAHQKLHCDSCRQEFEQIAPVVTKYETVFNGIPVDGKISSKLEIPENIAEYTCGGCGAKIILDTKTSMGTRCSWCRNELTANKAINTEFTPNGIIPFAITKENALETFRTWVKKHWFVRKDFAAKDSDIEIKPIYYPFYAVDRNAHYEIHATGERTKTRHSGNYVITKHEEYDLRTPSMAYVDDFELTSLTEIKDKLIINSIEPYDWTKVRLFDYAYLNSFAAEHRDIELHTVAEYIDKKLTQMIYADISGDLSSATRLEKIQVCYHENERVDDSIAYCLAPAWLITYTDKKANRVYFFAINGQTGKTSGILPISYQKLTLFIIVLTLIASSITTLINVIYLISSAGGNS